MTVCESNLWLQIQEIRCPDPESEHLPQMDKNGFCDPYVVVDILPFEYSTDLHVDHYAAKTKILHKTCNPVWDTSKMHINTCASDVDELVKHGALALTLFDHDTFSKDQIIGRVVIDLSECRAVEEGHGEAKLLWLPDSVWYCTCWLQL